MTAVNFQKRNTLVSINNHIIDLGLPILEALEVDALHVLRLNDYQLPEVDPNVGRNVVALDQDGNEKWRIQPFWHNGECERQKPQSA